MEFLTGRDSKLARLLENAIRNKTTVGVELTNGEVYYGTVYSYELSPSHLFVCVETEKKLVVVINFQQAIRMRVKT